jgi:branched-chain amino acid transport system permease protein
MVHISTQALFGQLLVGLINGSFYAMLSLGLAVIFGLLRVINLAHGTQYMLGAFAAYFLAAQMGLGYWPALILAPVLVAAVSMVFERTLLSRLYDLDHLYGFLLTFGAALTVEGLFTYFFGSTGLPYPVPEGLTGGLDIGFMFFPIYRGWVVVISLIACLGVWLLIEKTRLGSYLRAATENPTLVQVFGVNVPLMITLTYGLASGLAALTGVLAAPIYQVSPQMGANLMVIIFAVVVVGGMSSILGAIVTGYMLGLVEGLTKVFYPQASSIVIFVIMAIVLLARPAGLFGREAQPVPTYADLDSERQIGQRASYITLGIGVAMLCATPFVLYPVFVMTILCFAIFAVSFNLLLGYVGLLSFGHAAFFGGAAYFTAFAVKTWHLEPLSGILFGAVCAAAMGLVMGFVAIRRQGLYFAMVTLALAQMFYFVCLQAPFTEGENGIQSVPRGRLLGLIDLNDDRAMYFLVLLVFAASLFAVWRIVNSPFGNILKAIRENEPRAISLGYKVDRYKLAAFVMSAALAGVAGGMKAIITQVATLVDVDWHVSGDVVVMAVLGGLGTLFGPVLGAAMLIGLQTYLAGVDFPVTVLIGVIFLLCVTFFRRGIYNELARLFVRSGLG